MQDFCFFEVSFYCTNCHKPFAFTIKVGTHNIKEIKRRVAGGSQCPRCFKFDQHVIDDILELPIGHLEEFVRFV
jgi:bacterioferritin-associated ferredoxin